MVEITRKEFNSQVLEASNTKPVFVKFTASWCKFCTNLIDILW